MKTIELIMTTPTFLRTQNLNLISPSVIGIFNNAVEMKNAGYNYNEWLKQTCAGATTKQVVKEIFEYLA